MVNAILMMMIAPMIIESHVDGTPSTIRLFLMMNRV